MTKMDIQLILDSLSIASETIHKTLNNNNIA